MILCHLFSALHIGRFHLNCGPVIDMQSFVNNLDSKNILTDVLLYLSGISLVLNPKSIHLDKVRELKKKQAVCCS